MSDDDFMAQSDDEEYDFVRAAGSIFLSRLSKDALLIIITDIYIYIYNTCTLHTRVCSAALVQDYDSDDDGSDAGAADLENLVSTHALALFLK